jgi:hypothetical protein
VDEIRAWNGPALISCEVLAPATPADIKRLTHSLDFADVHVILTVRDMARQLPAAWQERVKNRGLLPFATWLEAVHEPHPEPRTPGAIFWDLHDIEGILARWSAGLPPSRVHVVTVPPAGGDASLLWKRFAQVIGVDPVGCRQPDRSVNTSLGAAEVSVVRQVNVALGGNAFSWPHYDRLMKWTVSPELAKRRGVPIELPEAEYDWAVAHAQRVAKTIADAGYDVVGDLNDLTPSSRPTGMNPDQVPGEQEAEAAVAGIAGLVRALASGGGGDELHELRAKVVDLEAVVTEHRDLTPGARIRRCFIELAGQLRWLGGLYRVYRRARGRAS